MKTISSGAVLCCPAGGAVFAASESGPLWRVRVGVVRLERVHGSSRQIVRLALPGDLIGVEALCGEPYRFDATALTEASVEPVRLDDSVEHGELMRQALLQQQTRFEDMTSLRTGPVAQRLVHMLRLLGHAVQLRSRQALGSWPPDGVTRKSLPPLRDIAHVVDAQHETVCRSLAKLLPQRQRREGFVEHEPLARAA